ncbi:MAG: histidinol-phosphate transaminase [Ruminococcus sp.]|nr:histidinol-phosphate transaminase [Ruminococcus sp.]
MSELNINFRDIEPYVPGEQPQYPDKIKLNTNENPYPPSPQVKKVLDSFNTDDLKLYPDPNASELVEAIADYYAVDKKNVFVGVGSDDVLAMCFMAFFNSGRPIIFPDITYSFYPVWANLFGVKYETKPLDDNFQIVKEDYFCENGGVIFPNPNAPTGVELSLDVIEEIVRYNSDRVVIVDEAYVDFGAKSALPLIQKYKNLVVVQTFSKSRSLAGLRIGFAIANEELISVLNAVKNSYNSYTMNSLTIKAGAAAIADDSYFKQTTDKIVETRENAKIQLSKLGFEFNDSKSNFIFARHKSVKAVDIFNALREKHIFVRYFNQSRIDNYLRITIGTDEEMQALIDFLTDYLSD